MGCFLKGGDIINCLLMSFTLINSLKLIFISLLLKLVLKFFGLLETILGEIVSFAPPVMVPLLAQLLVKIVVPKTKLSSNK